MTGADTATPNYFSISLTFSNILVFSPFYNQIDHNDTARLRGKDPVNTSATPEPIFTPSVLFSGHWTDCSCGQRTPIHLSGPSAWAHAGKSHFLLDPNHPDPRPTFKILTV